MRPALAEAMRRGTRPGTVPAWSLVLLVVVALEVFDVIDLHVEIDPTPLEQAGVWVQHATVLLLAIPAAIAAWRAFRAATKKKE